jgi:hypothetical protein
MTPYELIRRKLARVRSDIEGAARRVGRAPDEVAILPVTKSVGPETIRLLHQAGLRDFAESRVQRGAALARELAGLEGARWHLVGHLQRNKVRRALEVFHSIHSLDSARLADEIAAAAAGRLPPDLYVEVNVARAAQLLEHLRAQKALPLRGLMAMAPYSHDPEASRSYFQRLRGIRDERVRRGLLPAGAGLSMGMSADFAVAVEEGATVVRIGSLLFEGLGEPTGQKP